MNTPFTDRTDAGNRLAEALDQYQDRDKLLILALPRGGVPVAAKVAQHLNAEIDLMVVRKLGTPGHEELAMGAIASGGKRILNDEIIRMSNVSDSALEEVTEREQKELERREKTYRGDRPWPDVSDYTVIIVDDGVATGATMKAAADALRSYKPKELIIAIPVAPPDTVEELRSKADDIICLETPHAFGGIGRWYKDFGQTSDDEVRDLLNQFWKS